MWSLFHSLLDSQWAGCYFPALRDNGADRFGEVLGESRRDTRVELGMSKDFRAIFRDASELSEQDRATLAGLLIESLETEADPGVDQAWSAEIARRLAELDAGLAKTVPWEEVRQRLLDRLNAR